MKEKIVINFQDEEGRGEEEKLCLTHGQMYESIYATYGNESSMISYLIWYNHKVTGHYFLRKMLIYKYIITIKVRFFILSQRQ